jgi:aminoglycoside phosphotransferase (APT) family kinase protein
MEKVSGKILGDLMLDRKWLVVKYARILADVHARIHSCDAPDLPSVQEHLERRITSVSFLPEQTKSAVLKFLNGLPDGEAICHGDFYIDNIMVASDKPVVIDWIVAGRGNPLADVARTWMLHGLASWPYIPPGRFVIDPLRAILNRAYIARYMRKRPFVRDELDRWLIPVLAARLAEGVEGERDRFLKLIEKGLYRFA